MAKGTALLIVLLLALAACTGRAPAPTSTPAPDLTAAIEQNLATGNGALQNVRAVLISVDGQPQLEHYREGWTPDSVSHVYSVTKSVVALLAAAAVGDGVIESYDATLAELLPDHASAMAPWQRELTLRQLMTMSAGMEESRTIGDTIYAIFDGKADLVDRILRDNRQGKPGEWSYSNTSAHLAAAALDSALSRSELPTKNLWSHARARLFDPLGIDMTDAWTGKVNSSTVSKFEAAGRGWGTDQQGIPFGGIGVRLTAPDLLKLGQLVLDEGRWQAKQLIAAAPLAELGQPGASYPEYGMFWWRYHWHMHDVIVANGAEGQLIVVHPDRRAVIVIESRNGQGDYAINAEDLYPLVNSVIMPALDR